MYTRYGKNANQLQFKDRHAYEVIISVVVMFQPVWAFSDGEVFACTGNLMDTTSLLEKAQTGRNVVTIEEITLYACLSLNCNYLFIIFAFLRYLAYIYISICILKSNLPRQ